jgi:hypothetical protein
MKRKHLRVQRRDCALNGMWINNSKLLKQKGELTKGEGFRGPVLTMDTMVCTKTEIYTYGDAGAATGYSLIIARGGAGYDLGRNFLFRFPQ